ncbi:hypothetical protein Bpla01_59070 [Burkholderia plantarii]|nr:hypothetical protein Bpla01_59070 [Burkholderia plantarii]
MNTPSPTTYAVIAMLRVTGLWPKARAIAGNAVTMMLASTVSMNNAQATISGAMKGWTTGGIGGATRGKDAIIASIPAPALAEPSSSNYLDDRWSACRGRHACLLASLVLQGS